ncbi:MAG: trypsin-like peptidase domain-containing protein [Chloroflexi bacterium]|nr:trypsin-like peptidase domain-containing protein [Chloroflexota bacterium]
MLITEASTSTGVVLPDIGAAASHVAAQLSRSVVEVRPERGGAGAGTIWRADGVIVTNNHVAPGGRAGVVLYDGRRLAASIVAHDQWNDLAVLRVDESDLPAATIGDARALRPGELVLAVGHPFGVRAALTIGVVNGAVGDRSVDGGRELVRADVLLGPGNSGGPLADARGRVVGINAMVGGGLALAVPSHVVDRLLRRWERGPRLGIGVRDVVLPQALAAKAPKGAPGRHRRDRALLVTEVAGDSAAERAGLMLGDILLAVEGRPLEGTDGLAGALAVHDGGAMRLSLLRGGAPAEVVVHW